LLRRHVRWPLNELCLRFCPLVCHHFFGEITEAELSAKNFQTSSSSWGEISPAKELEHTARKRKQDFSERLSKVDEAGVSLSDMVDQQSDSDATDEIEFVADAPDISSVVHSEEEVRAKWPKLVQSITSLRSQLGSLSNSSTTSNVEFAEILLTVDKKLAILKGFTGSPPLTGSLVLQHGVDIYSMLEGLAGIWKESRAQLAQLLNAMQSDVATSMVGMDQIPTRIHSLERMLDDGGNVFLLLSNMSSRLRELEHVGHQTESDMNVGEPWGEIRELELRLQRVEEVDRGEKLGDSAHYESDNPSWESGMQEVILGRLEQLEAATEDADTGFEIGSQLFNSQEEVHEWLLLKGPGLYHVGHWVDPFSISCYAKTQSDTATQHLATKSNLERAKIHANQNEAIILLSFADDDPSLVGSSNEVHDTSVMLPKVKKFIDCYTEQGGLTGRSVYARWKRGAQKYSANLSKDLSRRWSKSSQEDFRAIAKKELASRTLAFIDELNTFVKEFKSELVQEGEHGVDDAEAWSLLSAMLSAIFLVMWSTARDHAGDKPNEKEDLPLCAARVLWGTRQSHRVMSQVRKVGFCKHPCVLPALTLHLFSRKASTAKVQKVAYLERAVGKGGGDSDRGVTQQAYDKFMKKDYWPLLEQVKELETKAKK